MNREQFLRSLSKHCKRHALTFDWRPGEGKGSHGTTYVEGRKTIIKSGELPKEYISAVLKQLGLNKNAI